MKISRREMLKITLSGMACFSTQATTPNWILRSAAALPANCDPGGRILVILQQAGGNDSLNTVIPRADPVYYDAATRPTIQIPAGAEINLDGLNGFHPRLVRLANWYQRGMVGLIQNVGYVNPNLSHFTSTDYYEYGYAPGEGLPSGGWAARYYDSACGGASTPHPLTMMVAGLGAIPESLGGLDYYSPPAVTDGSNYSLRASTDSALRLAAIHAVNSGAAITSEIDFIQRSESVTEMSITDVMTAAAAPALVPDGSYLDDTLGRGLKLASQIIRSGFPTRIFYVSQGGYDTHANQIQAADPLNAGDHPVLLDAMDRSIDAFLTEMELSGNLSRVLIMSFSEFGRRVRENSSFGTDHGAATCSFVIGGKVDGGFYGGQPDLLNLINGNLRHTVDFRSVYARVIETWFGASAAPVFGQSVYDTIIAPQLPNVKFLPTRDEDVKRYLLGQKNDPAGLDYNLDGATDAADLTHGVLNP